MLILTREMNEVIKIGDDIEVMVVGVRAGKVRLGIRAPREIPVHRAEVWDRIHGIDQAKRDIEATRC